MVSGLGSTFRNLLPYGIAAGTVVILTKVFRYGYSYFTKRKEDPINDFSSVCRNPRLWEKIPQNTPIELGKGNPHFLVGAATCTYQDSGSINCINSQWALREKTMPANNRSSKGPNLFEVYQNDPQQIIDRLKKLGVNSYRFSIEWSHIQPHSEKDFDEVKLQVYVNFCKKLKESGIKPMITLHHFSEPQWFYKLGSFEKEENIQHFVNFCVKVFPTLAEHCDYFCTINEPTIEAFSRYVRGAFLPCVTIDFKRGGDFLRGALKAHNLVYEKLKALKPTAQIGIVHQRLSFRAANPLLYPITRTLSYFVNEVTLNYFKTGIFEMKILFFCRMRDEKLGKLKTDFIGLQYYVRPLIGFGPTSDFAPMTQMPFHEDPEGIYEAILEVHEATEKPIIVTENGISTHDDTQRARYMWRALYATAEAAKKIRKEGLMATENLLGYYVWSLCDNFEWDMGMNPQKFGAYSMENGTITQNPKEGMKPFIAWANSLKPSTSQEQVV
ncbi:MAG: glycoside hydrolase family 1 protein [Verrucomicrobia bacterium]|nr:glycoside hydrolase family 1 protein [Verrucomicrobiota bacterium]